MKKLILIATVFLSSCGITYNPEDFYHNINLRIVKINSESSLTQDKFHNPQLCNTVLFETITGPKLYMEYNTCERDYYTHISIDTKWLYNHKIGDTVHFDYLRKYRFFEIKPELRPK